MAQPKPYYFELSYKRGAGTTHVHRYCKWLSPFKCIYVECRITNGNELWRIGTVSTATHQRHIKSNKRVFDREMKTALAFVTSEVATMDYTVWTKAQKQ